MRFMVIVKGTPETEGTLPTTQMLSMMMQYNEKLADAGVLLAGEGLKPLAKSVRVRFDDDKQTVIDGPFPESKEIIAGYWLLQVGSHEEAIDWVKQIPFGGGAEVEVRQVTEDDDFGDAFTPKLREKQKRLAQKMAENARR